LDLGQEIIILTNLAEITSCGIIDIQNVK